jgi:4-hydroxy-tetrahydrodipicolinate synthase
LWPLTTALFAEPSPGPVKAALAPLHGLDEAVRPPLTLPGAATRARVAQALQALQALSRR